MLPKPAAAATSVIGRRVSWISCLASRIRRVCAIETGEAPRCCRNSRRSWRSPMPSRAAKASTFGVIERAGFDQSERARDGVGTAAPERQFRRGLRPAAQTGAEAGLLRRGGGREEADVLPFGRGRRAERPAIDAGRGDRHEQAPVETVVAGLDGAVAGVVVHIHAAMISPVAARCLAVFGPQRRVTRAVAVVT